MDKFPESSGFSSLQVPVGLERKELVSSVCDQRLGPVHGLNWYASLNSHVAFRGLVIVVDCYFRDDSGHAVDNPTMSACK